MEATLFEIPVNVLTKQPDKFCRECLHRQRWQCGGTVIQYCGKRKNKRTENGLLKIKCKNVACCYFEKNFEKKADKTTFRISNARYFCRAFLLVLAALV
jgi:hypothetical protein